MDSIRLRAREVMNAITAFFDDAVELFDSRLSTVIELARRARLKATGADDENQRAKGFGVFVIEGTVDENVIGGVRWRCGQWSVERKRLKFAHDPPYVVQRYGGALGHRPKHGFTGQRAASQRRGWLGFDSPNGRSFRL